MTNSVQSIQQNVLREMQRVIHEQNLKELQRLNQRQQECSLKQMVVQQVSQTSVDVYA